MTFRAFALSLLVVSAAAPPAAFAGEAKGSADYKGRTLALQHVYLVKGPDAVDESVVIRELVFSAADLGAKIEACQTMSCVSGEVTEGMTLDYMALVEKRQAASLKYARSAQSYAVRTLAVDPEFYDVYCTTGFSEYLLGSIPFFLRWFIKFDDTEGSKEAGLRKLQIAATKGNYFKPFSKLLLAIFYLRQEEPAMSERYLAQFEAAYPENPLVKRERKKLAKMIAAIAAEQGK